MARTPRSLNGKPGPDHSSRRAPSRANGGTASTRPGGTARASPAREVLAGDVVPVAVELAVPVGPELAVEQPAVQRVPVVEVALGLALGLEVRAREVVGVAHRWRVRHLDDPDLVPPVAVEVGPERH